MDEKNLKSIRERDAVDRLASRAPDAPLPWTQPMADRAALLHWIDALTRDKEKPDTHTPNQQKERT